MLVDDKLIYVPYNYFDTTASSQQQFAVVKTSAFVSKMDKEI